MRTARRSRVPVFLLMIVLGAVLVFLIKGKSDSAPEETPDPHAGQIYINDGFDMVWLTPWEGVETNDISRSELRMVNDRPEYSGGAYYLRYGVDVSEHQWDIDWRQVASSGVDFAMIRLGYRGCTEGGLFEDPYYYKNMDGALAAGLDVGVYFFSQALTVQEAIEEAEYVIQRLKGYNVKMPVVFDWERVEADYAVRSDNMDSTILTDCAVAFCQTVSNAGYDACVYFNRHFGYYEFDLSRLDRYQFWIALPGEYPDFYYKCQLWQYSFSASIPGIEGETDMNVQFVPVAAPAAETRTP